MAASNAPSDASKALSEIVLVTIPAVILYFIGWVYLNTYLTAFGINVSELDLDLQTIFIYSLPPIRILFQNFWLPALIVLVVVLGLSFLLLSNLSKQAKGHLGHIWRQFCQAISSLRTLSIYAIIVVAAIIALPAIRWAAGYAANQKWTTEGFHIDAMIKEPETAKGSASPWLENYRKCSERHALDLIMSDKESYYMLCASSFDSSTGIVYEVRRDVGLVSIRYVSQRKR